jgi:hypothetical protein
MEKDCIWHFKPEGGGEIGPNDPLHITFKGSPYYSIVREAIQNSLDAVHDKSQPVVVSFQYFEMKRQDYPEFFKIEEHINQSLNYFENNPDARRLFGDMLKYLNRPQQGENNMVLSCLRISDSNTKGMYFDKGTTSPFYAFLRASGVSAKNQGSGGSFGFGKGAYFALSPIKTLIVSSKDIEGKVYFEGATRLTTHKDGSGSKISAFGFYDNNNGDPTTHENNIPDVFKRTETGTDVNIIGLWSESERNTLMIKSVLNNFWLAIYDGKLIVQVDDVIINKGNIEIIINEYFDGQIENGSPSNIELWNPKSYLRAVKYAGSNQQFKVFESELDTIGKVRLYVYLENGLPNRTSYFRAPRMVVYKGKNGKVNGYSAVFICDNDKGNEMLRLMENPAHNEWKLDNYPKDEGKVNTDARRGLIEIRDFINRTLETIAKTNSGNKIAFVGLEEYLSIPEDLLERDEQYDLEGMNTNNFNGQASNEYAEDETGMLTSEISKPLIIKPIVKVQPSEVKESSDIEISEDGKELITTGGENESEGGDSPPTEFGDDVNTGNRLDGGGVNSRTVVKVNLRVAAQVENGNLYHHLIINCSKKIAHAELEVLINADNDNDGKIEISTSDKGSVSNNIIKDLSLVEGTNKLKIRFADRLKHSLKLKAYEVQ